MNRVAPEAANRDDYANVAQGRAPKRLDVSKFIVRVAIAVASLTCPGAVSGQESSATPSSLYLEHCSICHGEAAAGSSNPDYQGSILTANAFVRSRDDGQLIAFLKSGRPPDAPDSQMHILMPAFDYLNNTELNLILKFLRRISP